MSLDQDILRQVSIPGLDEELNLVRSSIIQEAAPIKLRALSKALALRDIQA